ncbi:cytochrome P450 [Xylariomycetidae sp. FL2044]|nr:cytochrome P450 [Xylariomycetidae sp. FL2044]
MSFMCNYVYENSNTHFAGRAGFDVEIRRGQKKDGWVDGSMDPGMNENGTKFVFYHDVVLGGRYTHAIKKMHEEYGPIVRINPEELHCNDVAFSDEIYAAGGSRQAPASKFFSHGMIATMEGEIHELIDKLCRKLLHERYPRYCFGESFGLLDQEGWVPNFREATLAILKLVHVLKHLPFLIPITRMGIQYGKRLIDNPQLCSTISPGDIALFMKTLKYWSRSRTTCTRPQRIWTPAYTTSGRSSSNRSYIQSELSESERDPMRRACGCRTACPDRTGRTPTEEDLVYRGRIPQAAVRAGRAPRGYGIGMSAAITHHDETVFPDSHAFSEGIRGFSRYVNFILRCGCAGVTRHIPRMKLYETTTVEGRYVAYDYDMFVAMAPAGGSEGFRVTVD